jgi:hypothetical protein
LNKETLTSMEPTVMVVNPIVSRTLNFSRWTLGSTTSNFKSYCIQSWTNNNPSSYHSAVQLLLVRTKSSTDVSCFHPRKLFSSTATCGTWGKLDSIIFSALHKTVTRVQSL